MSEVAFKGVVHLNVEQSFWIILRGLVVGIDDRMRYLVIIKAR